jgi:GTP-binding protein
VGKSALFNRLVRQRRAVVEDIPGVTRDRLYAEVVLDGRPALLVDTGGLVGAENDELIGMVREQAGRALAEADVLLLLFDGQEGVTTLDWEVAEAARHSGKTIIPVVNKMESGLGEVAPFAELGLGMPLAISALHNQGIKTLEEDLSDALPPPEETPPAPEGAIAVAIIGRPNAGKSAIVNALLGQPRMIVSEIPGTTRDAVDTLMQSPEGQWFQLVDTPGLRKRGKRSQGMEFYSSLRTFKTLERATVGIVVFDANEGMTQQDAAIALEVNEAGRALVLVANKWDLVREAAFAESELSPEERVKAEKLLWKDFESLVRSRIKFAQEAPLLRTCALSGEGVAELLPLSQEIAGQFHRRLDTGPLNRALREAQAEHPPPNRGGRRLTLLYMTQPETAPPTFVLFVNEPDMMHFSYKRYLLNFLRQKFSLGMVPVRLKIRRSSGRE